MTDPRPLPDRLRKTAEKYQDYCVRDLLREAADRLERLTREIAGLPDWLEQLAYGLEAHVPDEGALLQEISGLRQWSKRLQRPDNRFHENCEGYYGAARPALEQLVELWREQARPIYMGGDEYLTKRNGETLARCADELDAALRRASARRAPVPGTDRTKDQAHDPACRAIQTTHADDCTCRPAPLAGLVEQAERLDNVLTTLRDIRESLMEVREFVAALRAARGGEQ